MTSPLSGTRLDPILNTVAERAAARREDQPLESLRQSVQADPARRARFCSALQEPGLSIIAECKRRSPSVGQLTAENVENVDGRRHPRRRQRSHDLAESERRGGVHRLPPV